LPGATDSPTPPTCLYRLVSLPIYLYKNKIKQKKSFGSLFVSWLFVFTKSVGQGVQNSPCLTVSKFFSQKCIRNIIQSLRYFVTGYIINR
jgi:hypothetical protein